MRKYLRLLRVNLLLMIQLRQIENPTLNSVLLGLWRLRGQAELVRIFSSH